MFYGDSFMYKLIYNNKNIVPVTTNLEDALLVSESLSTFSDRSDILSWNYILTRTKGQLKDLEAMKNLRNWGIHFEKNNCITINGILQSRRKKYNRDIVPINVMRLNTQYTQELQLVQDKFGAVLNDGTSFYDYQLEDVALISLKLRGLLAYEMGLGKTRTSLAAALSKSKKSILIITMSRNLNDWMQEIENIGYGDNYILLEHPRDLKSNRRIHLVSYEKWANELGRTTYRKKKHFRCPDCNCHYINSFFRDKGYCTVCKHRSLPTGRWSEKDMPSECPECGNEWRKGQSSCNKLHKDSKKCSYSIVEIKHHALSDFYKAHLYDATIVDEIHYIKNPDTKRSKSVRKIRSKMKIGLSGTPAENGTGDLFWILGWLTGFSIRFEDPKEKYNEIKPFQGYGKKGFENFTSYYGGGSKKSVFDIDSISVRISNQKELWNLLDSIMIRRRKTDEKVKNSVMVPEPKHHRYHVKPSKAEQELYKKILDDFANWYQEELVKKAAATRRGEKYKISTILICSWMRKLRQAASCPWIFPDYDENLGAKTSKMKYLESKVISQLRKGRKILIFSGHKETIEQLTLALDNLIPGKRADYIHGDVKKEARWEMIRRFQDPNDPLSILIMSHRTGCESYTLTQAKAVFLYDLDFNGKKIEQCYSRAVRLTQNDIVDIYWLLNADTIDCNMHALILSKNSGVDAAIDRAAIDMEEISKEFEGDFSLGISTLDYEEFAKTMLAAGTKRKDFERTA